MTTVVLFSERIQLEQFTLGEETPSIQSVRSFDVAGGTRCPVLVDKPSMFRSVRHQVGLEIGLFLNSEEFRMVLRARLFGKGYEFLIY